MWLDDFLNIICSFTHLCPFQLLRIDNTNCGQECNDPRTFSRTIIVGNWQASLIPPANPRWLTNECIPNSVQQSCNGLAIAFCSEIFPLHWSPVLRGRVKTEPMPGERPSLKALGVKAIGECDKTLRWSARSFDSIEKTWCKLYIHNESFDSTSTRPVHRPLLVSKISLRLVDCRKYFFSGLYLFTRQWYEISKNVNEALKGVMLEATVSVRRLYHYCATVTHFRESLDPIMLNV